MAYSEWTGPAKVMALAIDRAVTAAQDADLDEFRVAMADIAALDQEQLAVLLGAVSRDLLERSHPDGLDAEGADVVVQRCSQWAVTWYPGFDVDRLVLALSGSLGLTDPDESPVLDGRTVTAHGLLLIADQLTAMTHTLPPILDAALRELLRAQTVELP